MSLYCIGDLQGCAAPFERLLQAIDFSPSRDSVYLLGDLVNRGPDSLAVLRRVRALGNAASSLLGNHDLHLLAVAGGLKKAGRQDTMQTILDAPDRSALLDWLRARPLALDVGGWLMVHAGVLPQWTREQTLSLAAEVEAALQRADFADFLAAMYGNLPNRWDDRLHGNDRLRVIVNALTRLRFCSADGAMEFSGNGDVDSAPAGYLPWFDVPGRATLDSPIVFGHWSALVGKNAGPASSPSMRAGTLALDTGCVWGNCLTAAKLSRVPGEFELISVSCDELRPHRQKPE